MTRSPDEASFHILRNWHTDATRISVTLDSLEIGFSGTNALVSDMDEEGVQFSGDGWILFLAVAPEARALSVVPAEDPMAVMVKVRSGSGEWLLSGPRPGR